MALVHSRVRRVVFGTPDGAMGSLGSVAPDASDAENSQNNAAGICSLPGTNHHYRAFRLDLGSSGDRDEETGILVDSLKKLHADLV